jgi:acetate kinase
MADAILTLNAGSSSLKLGLFALTGDGPQERLRGQMEGIGHAPRLVLRDPDGGITVQQDLPGSGHDEFLPPLLDAVQTHLQPERLRAIGHRVVHGGADHTAPVLVDDDVLQSLDALTPLAPLHQPHNLQPIRTLRRLHPDLPQVACFDTAFHAGLSDAARRFALPRALSDAGIRRYGAHGLSYEYIASRLQQDAPRLAAGGVVVAHLGSGASLCAMQAGRSVETTMGLTPLDGLVMSTRCGAIDPGVVLYLQQARGMQASEVEDMLYHQSGLLGVSGISGDTRDLLRSDRPEARQALDLFIWQLTCRSARWRQRWKGWTGWCSPAALASTRRKSARPRAGACDSSG